MTAGFGRGRETQRGSTREFGGTERFSTLIVVEVPGIKVHRTTAPHPPKKANLTVW